jgi:hypothetical protein
MGEVEFRKCRLDGPFIELV